MIARRDCHVQRCSMSAKYPSLTRQTHATNRAFERTAVTVHSRSALSIPLSRCTPLLFPMFLWHTHSTFDFWNHHDRHKHHDRLPPSSDVSVLSDSEESPPYEVLLEPTDNPQELPLVRRWLAVICISTASICVTCASSMVRAFFLFDYPSPLSPQA